VTLQRRADAGQSMAGGEGNQIHLEFIRQLAAGGEQLQGDGIDFAVDVFDQNENIACYQRLS